MGMLVQLKHKIQRGATQPSSDYKRGKITKVMIVIMQLRSQMVQYDNPHQIITKGKGYQVYK